MARPMLDDVELQQVQTIEVDEDQVLAQHSVPALEGDFLQGLGRRATHVTLTGVLTGPEVGEGLKNLREKFRAAEPVPFVADITTATQVGQVLIEEMGVRELAGKPERFEYALTLREFTPPPAPTVEPPPPPPPLPPPPSVETGTLEVEVIVEGQPAFDFSRVTVTVEGIQEDGTPLSRTLTNRVNNVWTEENMPPGQYTATAVVTDPEAMSGAASAVVRAGQTARVTVTLRPGAVIAKTFIVHFRFDKSFVEPCMRPVLRQVQKYAEGHPDEKLLIVGHTDKAGPPDYNQSLSERRARSVFAYLTFGRDRAAALAEWDQLRRQRPPGVRRSINDTWGTREYQYILQDLGYYPGNVDGDHRPTDAAVRTFQQDKGLTVDGIVGDATWAALIDAYLSQDALAVPESQFLPNCPGEILKWLGCGEQDPVKNTPDAWRPNRRAELLFVTENTLPAKVRKPDTFELPPPNGAGPTWCLGDNTVRTRCCFVKPHILPRKETCPAPVDREPWTRVPAEPGTIVARGSIRFEDGTPAANVKYVLIAPDGEFMDGERPRDRLRGEGIRGRTRPGGSFAYPDKPKGIGVYTLELEGPFVARLEGEPPEAARGNVVCKRLDGTSEFDVFDVIVCQPATTFDLQVSGAMQVGGSASTTFLATRAASGDVIVMAVFPSGTCAAPQSITWAGGEDVPGNPLQRRVSRATIGQTTVIATMGAGGVTRWVDIFVVRVTLDVDADRDGMVEEDGAGKNAWEFGVGKQGAVILSNNDDDNTNTVIDNQNLTIDGADDVNDLAPLVIRRSGALPVGISLELAVADRTKTRIFDQRGAAGTAIVGPSPLPGEFSITNSDAADVEFGVEATQCPDAGFDGLIRLTLALKEGGTELARDEVLVRVAPWVMPSHMDETIELYVVETGDNATFVSEIDAIATAAGVPLKKTSNSDRWMQDTMEIGYSRMPGKENNVVFKAVRGRGLGPYARTNLLGPDFGFIEVSTPTGANTFDSHGNLEVSPPVQVGGKNFQLGRMYYGRGRPTEPFNSELEQFLIAQKTQKSFKIDTDWLAVGHVDEIISFVPSNAGGKDFRMLFSDTKETIRILTDLKNAGQGDLKLFEGHPEAISVKDLLDELGKKSVGELGWVNDFCQARLDGVKAQMKAELELSDSDIVPIPALFIENPGSPRRVDPASLPEFDALIPGMVNLLLINKPSFSDIQLVIAKPFGPMLGGVDQLEQDVRNKLAPLGYAASQLRFVDDYDTYHLLLGEVHCATNSKRRPLTKPWWEQTDF